MFAPIAVAALILEAFCGYPQALYRAAGHPVSWIGRLIAWCDERWNREDRNDAARRRAGVASLALVVIVSSSTACLVSSGARAALDDVWRWLALGVLGSTLLASRSLHQHVAAVAAALETKGLEEGRLAVSLIVGRDPHALDEAGVSRAAIESLAENFSDGLVAPLFWMVVAGLPGAVAYKAINTADSMIGHKSPRYRAFGWAAARTDDLINLPASRLAALWIIAAGAIVPGADVRNAAAAVARDARQHRSPNAGWPEAAMAGALGLKLGGTRIYDGETVSDTWMGDGRAHATPADIRSALRLYRVACAVQAAVVAILAMLVT